MRPEVTEPGSAKDRGLILTTVGVFPAVRHAHQTARIHCSPVQVLIFKRAAVDRQAASAIAFCDVSTLNHELIDNSVETAHLIGRGRL